MGLGLDALLDAVKNSIQRHSEEQQHTGFDASRLINDVTDLFGQHGASDQDPRIARGSVRPASKDPYGDPADQQGPQGRVRPASEDPYGDPADQERGR